MADLLTGVEIALTVGGATSSVLDESCTCGNKGQFVFYIVLFVLNVIECAFDIDAVTNFMEVFTFNTATTVLYNMTTVGSGNVTDLPTTNMSQWQNNLPDKSLLTDIWKGFAYTNIFVSVGRFVFILMLFYQLKKKMTAVSNSYQSKSKNKCVLNWWDIVDTIVELVAEGGSNTIKCLIAFISVKDTADLQTTSVIASSSTALAGALLQLLILLFGVVMNVRVGKATCRYVLKHGFFLFVMSCAMVPMGYSLGISIGFVDVYHGDSADFMLNIRYLVGWAGGMNCLWMTIVLVTKCCFYKPKN